MASPASDAASSDPAGRVSGDVPVRAVLSGSRGGESHVVGDVPSRVPRSGSVTLLATRRNAPIRFQTGFQPFRWNVPVWKPQPFPGTVSLERDVRLPGLQGFACAPPSAGECWFHPALRWAGKCLSSSLISFIGTRSKAMRVDRKDGTCRNCSGDLEIIDADDATMFVCRMATGKARCADKRRRRGG